MDYLRKVVVKCEYKHSLSNRFLARIYLALFSLFFSIRNKSWICDIDVQRLALGKVLHSRVRAILSF